MVKKKKRKKKGGQTLLPGRLDAQIFFNPEKYYHRAFGHHLHGVWTPGSGTTSEHLDATQSQFQHWPLSLGVRTPQIFYSGEVLSPGVWTPIEKKISFVAAPSSLRLFPSPLSLSLGDLLLPQTTHSTPSSNYIITTTLLSYSPPPFSSSPSPLSFLVPLH